MLVEYIGIADRRVVNRADLTARGLPDPGVPLVWDRLSGYELDVDPSVATFLIAGPDFRVKNSTVNFGSAVLAPRKFQWLENSDWNRFTLLPVNDTTTGGHTLALTADAGSGVADGSGGAAGDRRVYMLNGFSAQNMELTIDAMLTGGAQVGLIGRIQERGDHWVGVVAWINIVFGANANLLPGCWHWNKNGSGSPFNTNQMSPSLDGFKQDILSASGNGSVTTVRTRIPHYLSVASYVNCSFGSVGQVQVASVPDAFTFTVPAAWNGSTTTGTIFHLFLPANQAHRFTLRVVGNRYMMRQWLPAEPEPSWMPAGSNGYRVAVGTIPASLTGGVVGPTSGQGGAGIIIAHIGDTNVARVANFTAESLDAAA